MPPIERFRDSWKRADIHALVRESQGAGELFATFSILLSFTQLRRAIIRIRVTK